MEVMNQALKPLRQCERLTNEDRMMLMHAWYEGSIVSQNYNRIQAYELNYLEVHQFTQASDATMECSNFFGNSQILPVY